MAWTVLPSPISSLSWGVKDRLVKFRKRDEPVIEDPAIFGPSKSLHDGPIDNGG